MRTYTVITALLCGLAIATTTGCITRRPDSTVQPRSSTGSVISGVIGAAGGALIGKQVGGKNGTVVGAAAGALVAQVGTEIASNNRQAKLEEAREAGAREARARVLIDYQRSRTSQANPSSSGEGSKPKTVPADYPAGVYDGVVYGPRTESVPAQ